MRSELKSQSLRGKRVVIVGVGRSGQAAARLCLEQQAACVTLTDSRPAEQVLPLLGDLAHTCTLELGGHTVETFLAADLIVVSPGVPPIEPVNRARSAGIPVIGEVELAYRHIDPSAKIVGITGTNGKSTTTELIGEMVRCQGVPCFCGGNLGTPLSEAVLQPTLRDHAVFVVELSSFQLETVDTFRVDVAIMLNLSEDHLDRYDSYGAYKSAKARIFERQCASDYMVLPSAADQKVARDLARGALAQTALFGDQRADVIGGWIDRDVLCLQLPDGASERYERASLRLAGKHNSHNALAALLAARLCGVSQKACREALENFRGLSHRMQFVDAKHDVFFYNDSKATNVGAVVGSLDGFDRPVVLIAGGKDKHGDYAPLRILAEKVCRHVVLIGEARQRMADALRGVSELHYADDMHHAVTLAADLAQPGDAVVLSPACSSYDMFANYEQRGNVFVDAVKALS